MAEQMQPMPDVPERCPQCHSPVVERFPPLAVMYDCGFWFFNDEQPVTDDYPAECQRRRIKRLGKQLAAASAEAERWRQQYEALRAGVEHVLQLIAREERNEGFLEPDLEEIRRMLTAALGEAGGGGAVVVLTHDDCNTLMHGLRSREELEGDLLPEALEHYERLATRIIDVGAGLEPQDDECGGGGL